MFLQQMAKLCTSSRAIAIYDSAARATGSRGFETTPFRIVTFSGKALGAGRIGAAQQERVA